MTSLVASEEVTGEPVDSTPEVTGGQEPLMGPCGTQSEDQERFESSQEEVNYISS